MDLARSAECVEEERNVYQILAT